MTLTLVKEEIENYAKKHSMPESQLLRELFKETYEKTKIPQMIVGHLQGAFLKLLVKLVSGKRVLEIGTFTGYSALAMASGLEDGGELITCDVDDEVVNIAKKYWKQSPHGKKIKFILGNALETLQKLSGLFDLVFIDADKVNYVNYWDLCVPKVTKGGLIVVDNVLWGGRVLNPKEEEDFAIDKFNKYVVSDSRVEVVMLPVRDGITIAYKV